MALILFVVLSPLEAQKTVPKPEFKAENASQNAPKQYKLPPEKRLKAIAYARARHRIYFLDYATEFAVLLLCLWSGIAARLRAWAVPVTLAILTLADLPWDARRHWLAVHYGISIQHWGGWFSDWSKGAGLGLVFGALILWGVYWLMRRSPARWWFYAWCVAIPLTVLIVYVEPFVIEPLFNRFEPLGRQYPQLAMQIEEILARAHVQIPRDHLFVMKASEKTNELNAYVSGFGSSKRVVLYDTIIAKEPGPPLLTTFGHELGHYVLHHVTEGVVFGLIMTFFGFLIAHLLLRWRTHIGGWETVPLLLLLFTAGSFLGDPIANAFSRHLEHEADRYALEITHGIVPDAGKAAAVAFQIEGEADLEDPSPGPFVKFWLYSHPPIADRLQFALNYDPWREGQKPKYVR